MPEHIGITWAPNLKDENARGGQHGSEIRLPQIADKNEAEHESTETANGIPAQPTMLSMQNTTKLTKEVGQGSIGDDQDLGGDRQVHDGVIPEVENNTEQIFGSAGTRAKIDHYHVGQNVDGNLETTPFSPQRSSTQTSSSSLKSMSEREQEMNARLVRRALSARSPPGHLGPRRPSHSKSASTSQPISKRLNDVDHPVYPDQSFASLQAPFNSMRPVPPLRTRSSHPAQNVLYNDVHQNSRLSRDRQSVPQGTKTADNTPMPSPNVYMGAARSTSLPPRDDMQNTPQLHHLQAPKETHTAEIEHDTYSGNKFINNYEIVTELGRGEHGKVKLGRDIEKGTLVAVKIVPRYSGKRRLGRLGAPEDRTKREVAILKKARHPNVVSLLEVIDDPNKNKVYLILEYVEKGEIKWRKPGVREVLAIINNRYEQEKAGINITTDVLDRDLFAVAQAQRRHQQRDKARIAYPATLPNWSLEYGDETDEEEALSDISRSASRQFTDSNHPSRTNSHDDHFSAHDSPLAGSMYGAYIPEAYRARNFSIAASAVSHMSSELNFDECDDERSYVPALTLEEARRTFRDTLLGLEFLHFIGIIHRDIKPANLLVAAIGSVKISDFGVSYLGRPTSDEDPDNKLTEHDVSQIDDEKELARSVGTPAFWAPELCYEDPSMFEEENGPKITGALDLWALGITLYCMIYARLPFYANDEMGLHEAVCRADVFLPKTRLVPVDTSKEKLSAHSTYPINSNKRFDYDLKFEVVPDSVRDLIGRLLVKDPVKRMTILEAKKHPWVVEGIADPAKWIDGPHFGNERKNKILDVDEKEMSHAVGKRNIIERAINNVGRLAGSILGRRDNNRKRASSAATSTSHSSESAASPLGSNASTVGRGEATRNSRRTSLRGDEVVNALKASRDTSEHPLAQSQTASPDLSPRQSYFEDISPSTTENGPKDSTGITEQERRPRGPDRGLSSLSTAESVRTIRPSRIQRANLPDLPSDMEPSTLSEPSLRSRVEGLWEGTTKTLARLTSRDRGSWVGDRSPASSRKSSEGDAHASPSLALSNASAAGAIQAPAALQTAFSPTDPIAGIDPSEQDSSNPRRHSSFQPAASTEAAFEHARDINQRRLILEAKHEAEVKAAAEVAAATTVQIPTDDECPPSPDDITYLQRHLSMADQGHSQEPNSLNSIAAAPSATTIASSLDDLCDSSVSQSISNPSFGIVSGASSPPGDSFLVNDQKDIQRAAPTQFLNGIDPPFMRTADTIVEHGRPINVTATGHALEDQDVDTYDDKGDDEYDSSSEEEGIIMGGPTKRS